MRFTSKRTAIAALFGLASLLPAQEQPDRDELLRLKKAAEAMHVGIIGRPLASAPSGSSLTRQKLELERRQKQAAEALHVMSAQNKTVTGKPYSGEAITETVQTLADGNRITRRNVVRQYRDSAGRTRQEQTIEALGPSNPVEQKQVTVIFDPVSKSDLLLNADAKLAIKLMRADASGAEAITSLQPSSENVVKEDLGAKTIEGLQCTGTRTTITIPANQIGNERPIQTVTETWYSPDIEAVVQSQTTDPRFGSTSYRLQNVQRGDPPAQLFEAPSDYRVMNAAKPVGLRKPEPVVSAKPAPLE